MVFVLTRLESFAPDFKEFKYKTIHSHEKDSIVKDKAFHERERYKRNL